MGVIKYNPADGRILYAVKDADKFWWENKSVIQTIAELELDEVDPGNKALWIDLMKHQATPGSTKYDVSGNPKYRINNGVIESNPNFVDRETVESP